MQSGGYQPSIQRYCGNPAKEKQSATDNATEAQGKFGTTQKVVDDE